MSNKVEIVKIIGALRARDLPALFYLYQSETTEVHQIAWLPKTVIALLVERHFIIIIIIIQGTYKAPKSIKLFKGAVTVTKVIHYTPVETDEI